MTVTQQVIHWVNKEIPAYLEGFETFEEFDANMPEACASGMWKQVAYAMASERWGVKLERIPR